MDNNFLNNILSLFDNNGDVKTFDIKNDDDYKKFLDFIGNIRPSDKSSSSLSGLIASACDQLYDTVTNLRNKAIEEDHKNQNKEFKVSVSDNVCDTLCKKIKENSEQRGEIIKLNNIISEKDLKSETVSEINQIIDTFLNDVYYKLLKFKGYDEKEIKETLDISRVAYKHLLYWMMKR